MSTERTTFAEREPRAGQSIDVRHTGPPSKALFLRTHGVYESALTKALIMPSGITMPVLSTDQSRPRPTPGPTPMGAEGNSTAQNDTPDSTQNDTPSTANAGESGASDTSSRTTLNTLSRWIHGFESRTGYLAQLPESFRGVVAFLHRVFHSLNRAVDSSGTNEWDQHSLDSRGLA